MKRDKSLLLKILKFIEASEAYMAEFNESDFNVSRPEFVLHMILLQRAKFVFNKRRRAEDNVDAPDGNPAKAVCCLTMKGYDYLESNC